jgi:hypothetical protein
MSSPDRQPEKSVLSIRDDVLSRIQKLSGQDGDPGLLNRAKSHTLNNGKGVTNTNIHVWEEALSRVRGVEAPDQHLRAHKIVEDLRVVRKVSDAFEAKLSVEPLEKMTHDAMSSESKKYAKAVRKDLEACPGLSAAFQEEGLLAGVPTSRAIADAYEALQKEKAERVSLSSKVEVMALLVETLLPSGFRSLMADLAAVGPSFQSDQELYEKQISDLKKQLSDEAALRQQAEGTLRGEITEDSRSRSGTWKQDLRLRQQEFSPTDDDVSRLGASPDSDGQAQGTLRDLSIARALSPHTRRVVKKSRSSAEGRSQSAVRDTSVLAASDQSVLGLSLGVVPD